MPSPHGLEEDGEVTSEDLPDPLPDVVPGRGSRSPSRGVSVPQVECGKLGVVGREAPPRDVKHQVQDKSPVRVSGCP